MQDNLLYTFFDRLHCRQKINSFPREIFIDRFYAHFCARELGGNSNVLRDWTNGCDTRNVTATRPYCFLSKQIETCTDLSKTCPGKKITFKHTGYGFLPRFKVANSPCRKVFVTQSGSRCKNCSFKLFALTEHIVLCISRFFLPFPYLLFCTCLILVAHWFIFASDPKFSPRARCHNILS